MGREREVVVGERGGGGERQLVGADGGRELVGGGKSWRLLPCPPKLPPVTVGPGQQPVCEAVGEVTVAGGPVTMEERLI